MELSAKVEYALIALLEIASQPNQKEPFQIKHIADKHAIPDRYLEQVFASLRQAGILRSQRGNKGGYFLVRQPWQVTVLEIVNCLVDAKPVKPHSDPLSVNRSIVHELWKEVQQSAFDVLQRHTLQDLCQRQELIQQLGGMYHI